MKSITLTQDGARRLLRAMDVDTGRVYGAMQSAEVGDFAPLAALVGEAREEAGEFRAGDVVMFCGAEWAVTGTVMSKVVPHSDIVYLRRDDEPEHQPSDPRNLHLLRRREFRAGEACPVVAVGQERVCNALGLFPYTVVDNQGGRVNPWRLRWADGKLTEMRAEAIATDLLSAPWTAPEAVEVKR